MPWTSRSRFCSAGWLSWWPQVERGCAHLPAHCAPEKLFPSLSWRVFWRFRHLKGRTLPFQAPPCSLVKLAGSKCSSCIILFTMLPWGDKSLASSAGCCLYGGRAAFPIEIVYLNYVWRLQYEIPGADETWRNAESRDSCRQLKSIEILGYFFFLKPEPNQVSVIGLIESPVGFSQKSTLVTVRCRWNQLQYLLLEWEEPGATVLLRTFWHSASLLYSGLRRRVSVLKPRFYRGKKTSSALLTLAWWEIGVHFS